jgi:hypothetical protein
MPPWIRPAPWWVRHPNVGGALLFVALVLIGVALTGCECGVGWPCPEK